jgi:hypothetical protein
MLSKNGAQHRLYNKLDGALNLQQTLASGKLPNVGMERFEQPSREQIRELVIAPNRKHPLLVRSTSLGDTNYDKWNAQPRRKFVPISMKDSVERDFDVFLRGCEKWESENEPVGLFVVHLPITFTVAEVGLEIDHATWHYSLDVKVLDPPLSTFEEATFRKFPTFYSETGNMEHGSANVLSSHPKQYANFNPADIVRDCIPAFVEEFKGSDRASEVRFVIYQNDGSLYAYDWLLK